MTSPASKFGLVEHVHFLRCGLLARLPQVEADPRHGDGPSRSEQRGRGIAVLQMEVVRYMTKTTREPSLLSRFAGSRLCGLQLLRAFPALRVRLLPSYCSSESTCRTSTEVENLNGQTNGQRFVWCRGTSGLESFET